jgi:hypothetical protein
VLLGRNSKGVAWYVYPLSCTQISVAEFRQG